MNPRVAISDQRSAVSQNQVGSPKCEIGSVPRSDFRVRTFLKPQAPSLKPALLALLPLLLVAAPASAQPQLSITGISPDSAYGVEPPLAGEQVFSITGSIPFPADMTATLSKAGQPDIVTTDVQWVSSSEIAATFAMVGAAPGIWTDLEVTHNTLGSDTLSGELINVRTAPSLSRLSAWGGPVQAMQVVGNLGYVARGSGMVILDVTDPANLVELGSIDLAGSVYDVAVQGDYAYVCGDENYLSVVDVSDPLNPRLVVSGLHPFGGSGHQQSATNIAIYGNTAYVLYRYTLGHDGPLFALDISDPESLADPTGPDFHMIMGPYPGNPRVQALAVQGDYLYVAGEGEEPYYIGELWVYDVSADPLDPTLVGTASVYVYLGQGHIGLDVEGERAYVTVPLVYAGPGVVEFRLIVVDVSEPTAPFVSGFFGPTDFELSSWVNDVAVSNGIAYLADYEDESGPDYRMAVGLAVVDLTDLSDPTLLATHRTHGALWGLTLGGDTVYLLDRGEGVIAMDVTDPAAPTRLGNWHSPAFIQNIEQEGDLLYFSDVWNGITALDVSDPRTPTLVGVYQSEVDDLDYAGHIGSVRVQNGFAYLPAGYNGLEVVDFADPANPVLVGGYQSPAGGFPGIEKARTLAVKDNVLVVDVNFGNGIFTFVVNDPANPIPTSYDDFPGYKEEWGISDDFLAVGIARYVQSTIIDVADPYNPIVLAAYPDAPNVQATDIFMEGNRLYGVNAESSEDGRFSVYAIQRTGDDVDLPLLAEFMVAAPRAVAVQDGIAYVAGEGRKGTGGSGSPTFWHPAINAYDVVNLQGVTTLTQPIALSTREFPIHSSLHPQHPYIYAGGNKKRGEHIGSGLVVLVSAMPGDFDGDFVVGEADYDAFVDCFTGPDVEPADADCLVFDFDQDNDVDCSDWVDFREAYRAYSPGGDVPVFPACPDLGDADGDGDADLYDFASFQCCFAGEGVPADPDCLTVHDFDYDDDVDLDDFEVFARRMARPYQGIFWATTDQAEFEQFVAAQGGTLTGFEDFEEATGPGPFPPPLDEFTDNGIFSPGDITAGLTIQPNDLGGAAWSPYPGSSSLWAYVPPMSGATSKGVEDASSEDSLDLIFDPAANVTAVGFDTVAFDFDRKDVQIMVFDTDNNLLRRYNAVSGSAAGEFFGVWSNEPIGRINLWTPDINGDRDYNAADNIQMWTGE